MSIGRESTRTYIPFHVRLLVRQDIPPQHIPLCPLPLLHYYNSKQQSGITSYLYMSRFNMSLVLRHTFLLACRAHASHHTCQSTLAVNMYLRPVLAFQSFCYARLQHPTRDQELCHLLRGAFQGLVLFPFLLLEKTVTSRDGKFFSSVFSNPPPAPWRSENQPKEGSQYVSLFDATF